MKMSGYKWLVRNKHLVHEHPVECLGTAVNDMGEIKNLPIKFYFCRKCGVLPYNIMKKQ